MFDKLKQHHHFLRTDCQSGLSLQKYRWKQAISVRHNGLPPLAFGVLAIASRKLLNVVSFLGVHPYTPNTFDGTNLRMLRRIR